MSALYEARRGKNTVIVKVAHDGCVEQLKRDPLLGLLRIPDPTLAEMRFVKREGNNLAVFYPVSYLHGYTRTTYIGDESRISQNH